MTQQSDVKLTLEYGFKDEFEPGDRFDAHPYHWLRTTVKYKQMLRFDLTMIKAADQYDKAALAERFTSSVNEYFLKKYQIPATVSAEEILKVIQP